MVKERSSMEAVKLFDIPDGGAVRGDSFIVNCHVCGEVVSPVKARMIATEKKEYFLDTFCRVCILIPDDPSVFCKHKHFFTMVIDGKTEKAFTIMMYDKKDDMQGKIHPMCKGEVK